MTKVRIEHDPDTEREAELKRLLVEMNERYAREAQPLIDELTKINMHKTPRYFIEE